MEQIGYSLIDGGGTEIKFWGDSAGAQIGIPNVVRLPNGDDVHCPSANVDYQGYRLVPRLLQTGSPESIAFDGANIVVTRPAPPPPDPGTQPPRLIASALNIAVSNGDIASISGAFNLVAAIYLDVGQFMLLFLTPQPDANYFPLVTGSAPSFTIADQTADYLIVNAMTDSPGIAIDPANFSVQVFRAES